MPRTGGGVEPGPAADQAEQDDKKDGAEDDGREQEAGAPQPPGAGGAGEPEVAGGAGDRGRDDAAGQGELGADLAPAGRAAASLQGADQLEGRHEHGEHDVEQPAEAGAGETGVVHQCPFS